MPIDRRDVHFDPLSGRLPREFASRAADWPSGVQALPRTGWPLIAVKTLAVARADNESIMVKFVICTSIESFGARRFVARAFAIPCGVEQRCAPEERIAVCPSLEKARAAQARLAHALAEDVAARGNFAVDADPGFLEASAVPGGGTGIESHG